MVAQGSLKLRVQQLVDRFEVLPQGGVLLHQLGVEVDRPASGSEGRRSPQSHNVLFDVLLFNEGTIGYLMCYLMLLLAYLARGAFWRSW